MHRAVLAFAVALACSSPSGPPPRGTTTPPTSPPAADPAPPGLRLPGDVRPQRIALELTLVPDLRSASGIVRVAARVVRPTGVVWMHAEGLEIGHASVDGLAARVISAPGMIGLVAGRELAPGDHAIEVAFSAPIDREKSRGIYSEHEAGARYAYTFFEPIDARRAFPAFDEPSYKCPWQLTFHVREDHVALGNAPVVREVAERDGMKRVELAPTPPLPSYLVAFVVGPFELVDGGTTGRARTPIRFVIPRGRGGELGWAKQVTPRVVAALEDYFDMTYPFGKLDVAVVPRFWGTMEHPGLVAMGQPLTLIRPDQETRDRKLGYANILAHELAHYWFGDVVTMLWWDDTWLNEALAEWLDPIITDAVEPGWHVLDRKVGIATSAMEADETLSTQAIHRDVTTPEGIAASFDNDIVYAKGASVLRMFEAYAGPDRWKALVRAHIRGHLWGNASSDDLMRRAAAMLGAPVEAGLRSFVEQPGVPRITAIARCPKSGGATIALTQARSLPTGIIDPSPKTWHVPVCLRYGNGAVAHAACTMLDAATAELPARVCPTWILANAGANGYHRTAIDLATAQALLTPNSPIARIAKPSIPERMMIVADVRAAAERGELGIEHVLALVPTIAADPEDRVALSAFEAASFRADVLDDALYQRALRFVDKAFAPRARELGWKRAPGDTDERQRLRRAFVGAVARRDPALGKQAEQLADTWLATRSGVADDLVPVVLAAAAYRGTAARFDRIVAALARARDRSELQRLYNALGQFRDPALVARTLELVLDRERDLRDTLGAVFGIAFTRETRALGRAFLTDHLDELLGRMRDDEAAGFLGALAGGSCDPESRAAIATLVGPRATRIDGAQQSVTRGLEQADQCIAASARQRPALVKFLATY